MEKRANQSTNFILWCALMKVHPIPHDSFETTRSRFIQISHHCSLSWKKTPLYFFSSNLYTFNKKSSSKWNFQTFEWVGENSPNSLCHPWNYKSFLVLTLHHSSVSWEMVLLYFLTMHDLDKRGLSKCKISDFWLLA